MSRIYLIVREYTYTYAQSASLCPTWGDTHHEWARELAMKKSESGTCGFGTWSVMRRDHLPLTPPLALLLFL